KLSARSNEIIQQYHDYLLTKWIDWLTNKLGLTNNQRNILTRVSEIPEDVDISGIDILLIEEMRNELTEKSVIFRLIGYCSLFEKIVPDIFNVEILGSKLNSFLSSFASFENFRETLKIPEELIWRLLKLSIEAYPAIIINRNTDRFFIIDLIEAYSGENISDAQMIHYDNWLSEMISTYRERYENNNADTSSLSGIALIEHLLGRTSHQSFRGNVSRPAIERQLNKARSTLRSLAHLISFDTSNFAIEFAKRDNKYSFVSNVIFDLSGISSPFVQRGLLFSVLDIVFEKYKSREINVTANGYQVLFVLEEARILIPKTIEDDRPHPATVAAIRSTRRIATEGRKMGLGLLIISQKPSAVDNIPISQCNTLILHRVINPDDLNFVRTVGEAISEEDITTLKIVDRGVSLV